MTHELTHLFGSDELAEHGISHPSDNVLILQYVRSGEELGRVVTVLKNRATAHEPVRRGFRIGADGIVLNDPLAHRLDDRVVRGTT